MLSGTCESWKDPHIVAKYNDHCVFHWKLFRLRQIVRSNWLDEKPTPLHYALDTVDKLRTIRVVQLHRGTFDCCIKIRRKTFDENDFNSVDDDQTMKKRSDRASSFFKCQMLSGTCESWKDPHIVREVSLPIKSRKFYWNLFSIARLTYKMILMTLNWVKVSSVLATQICTKELTRR